MKTVIFLIWLVILSMPVIAKGKNKDMVWPYNGLTITFHTPSSVFKKVKAASIRFNKMVGFEIVDVVSSEDLKCLEKNQLNEICPKPNLFKKSSFKGSASWSYHTTAYSMKKFECDIFLPSYRPLPLVIEHEMGHCVGFNHTPKGLMKKNISFAKPFIYKPQLELWFSLVIKGGNDKSSKKD